VRWRRLGRRISKRVKVIALERERKISTARYVVRRDHDGRTWAGPYRWQGITFTEAERFWYQFTTIESANAAIIGSGFVGVSVRQIA
jgi:hypothetical protein